MVNTSRLNVHAGVLILALIVLFWTTQAVVQLFADTLNAALYQPGFQLVLIKQYDARAGSSVPGDIVPLV